MVEESSINIVPFGDTGILVSLPEKISETYNQRIRAFCLRLREEKHKGISEWIPAYNSVTVLYNPLKLSFYEAKEYLEDVWLSAGTVTLPPSRVHEIPVCYGGDCGPDLEFVAKHNGLAPEEVIRLHSMPEYFVYMMGFTPGFPYLGGMPREIAAPRLEVPRASIPKGAVGIAGEQTGIYSLETPGGWRLIGRTPIQPFNPDADTPMVFEAGDYIKFVPVTENVFLQIEKDIEAGTYSVKSYQKDVD